jgi:hypothetical protein
MAGYGVELRMDILRKAADQQMLKPLRTHGWTATIASEHVDGEYLTLSASKSGANHSIALMYSSATDNRHYRQLDATVDHIFTNGALYMVENFAHGVSTPVSPIDDFFPVLVAWNKQLAPETIAPIVRPRSRTVRRITAERPVDGIWANLTQFGSVKLAYKLVERRANENDTTLSVDQIHTKAAGLAFTVRNAADYFRSAPNESLNRRILSLYYGSLALAFAEMLASPFGASDLDEVEGMTKQGHGLFTVPSATDDFGTIHVGVLASGFFPRWATFLGHSTNEYPRSKPKTPSDLEKIPSIYVATIGELLSTIPELGALFLDVYSLEPSWIIPMFDVESNHLLRGNAVGSSYVRFFDKSARITADRLRMTHWPIAELAQVETDGESGNVYRTRVDHAGFDYWHDVLPIHHSPFTESGTLILPALAGVSEYRAISLVVLYALSILVRYMPSAWRRVEGGDWDHHSALLIRMLDVFERMVPQQYLESITGDKVYSSLPGGLL